MFEIKLWCLPKMSQKKLRWLHTAIVNLAIEHPTLGVKSEEDMSILFPSDDMDYGRGSVITAEILGPTDEVMASSRDRMDFAENLRNFLVHYFHNAEEIFVRNVPWSLLGETCIWSKTKGPFRPGTKSGEETTIVTRISTRPKKRPRDRKSTTERLREKARQLPGARP